MPYDSSQKPETDPNAPGTPLRAVLTGLAIDICGTQLLAIALEMIYAIQIGAAGMTPDQLNEALENIPPQSGVMIAGHMLGALLSVVAGYACARIVQRDEYRVGAIMAGVGVMFNVATMPDDAALDMMLLLVLCDFACNMLGVKYGAEYNRRREAPIAPSADPPADNPAP